MSTPDVVIVGAGAAGIGAGMALQQRGIPFLIVEGADRIGGRAFTDTASLGTPWDHGCHWLHCADVNPLVAHAQRLGSQYLTDPGWEAGALWIDGALASKDEVAASNAAVQQAFDTVYTEGERGRDVAISDVLPDAGRWARGARHVLQLMIGDDPETDSAAAYAEYDDTDHDWPVVSGYGALIAAMADGLPIRLNTPVSGVTDRAGGVRVETGAGTINAKAAIVTVSTNVLAGSAIAFSPGPAAEFVEKARQFPCGAFEKVAFALSNLPAEFREIRHLMIYPDGGAPAIDFKIADGPIPTMIAHIAGTPAFDLMKLPAADRIVFARDRLISVMGPDVAKLIVAAQCTNWVNNPLIGGSYSHALPGAAQLRRDLIAADTGNVAFAGEALSAQWQATAHGAWQSGQDVATRIAAQLG